MSIYSFHGQMWNAYFLKGKISKKYFESAHNRETIRIGTFEGTVEEPTYFFECTFDGEVDLKNCVLIDCKGDIPSGSKLLDNNIQVYNFKEPEPLVYVFETEKMALNISVWDIEQKYKKEHGLI